MSPAKGSSASNAPQPSTRRRGGRRSAITPAVAERIIARLREGLPFRQACALAGASFATLRHRRDPKDPQYDAELAARIEEAYEYGTAVICQRVVAAGKRGEWRADFNMLAVREPETFGRRVTVNGSTSVGVKVEIEASLVAAAQLRADPELLDAIMRQREVAANATLALAAHDERDES